MEAESSPDRGSEKNLAILPASYRLHWYEFESVLGRGGFGITYLARDTNLNHRVAIKEFLPSELAARAGDRTVHPLSEEYVDMFKWGLSRFIEEAQTLARFNHPNIVPVRSVFEANNTAYMIMDYVEGLSFAKAMRSPRYNGEAALRKVFLQLLDGVEQIHKAGYIHRDIKPDNIFLQRGGVPVLLDFGSARQSTGAKTMTALVTPGYAPFEQYDTSNEADRQGPWTDIYALGALLYRTVTGRAPPDAMARMTAKLDDKEILEPASRLAAGEYTPAFLQAIDNALAFRPADRPQSIAAWREQFADGTLPLPEDDAPTVVNPGQPMPGANDSDTVPGHTESQATNPASPARTTGRRTRGSAETVLDEEQTARQAATASGRGKSPLLAAVLVTLLTVAGALGYYLWQKPANPVRAGAETLPATLPYRAIRAPEDFLKPHIDELNEIGRDYRAILALDSNNSAALAGLSDLGGNFIELATFARTHFSSSLAATVIAAGLKVVPGNTGLLEQQSQLDAAVTAGQPSAAARKQVEQWTSQAKQDIKELRLVEPPGKNAVSRLKAIRSLDPENKFAEQQLERLGRFFHDAARAAFVKGDVRSGVQKLEQGLLISPSHPQLLALRADVSSRMGQPAR